MREQNTAQDALERFIDETLQNTAGEPSADFTARLMARVAQTPQTKRRTFPTRRALSAVAACAVVVLGLGFFRFLTGGLGAKKEADASDMAELYGQTAEKNAGGQEEAEASRMLPVENEEIASRLRSALDAIDDWDKGRTPDTTDGSFTLDGETYTYSLAEELICGSRGCGHSQEICRILTTIKENQP